METRKVQRVGNGTYTVSLPKEWAEAEGVSAGTVVGLHEHRDGLLVIETGEGEADPTDGLAVPVDGESPARVERALRAAYAAGVEVVAIEATEGLTGDQRRAARRVADGLAGFAVAEESDTRLVVRALLDPTEVSVRQSLHQLQFVALSAHREATAALVGDRRPAAPGSRDDQADRLFAMVDRHFARGLTRLSEVDDLGISRAELFDLRATARELERVADHAEEMAACAERTAGDSAPGAVVARPETFADLATSARGLVETGVGVVLGDGDADDAQAALDDRDDLRAELSTVADDVSGDAGEGVRAFDRLRRTVEHGGNVAEFGLRAAMRRRASGAVDADGKLLAED